MRQTQDKQAIEHKIKVTLIQSHSQLGNWDVHSPDGRPGLHYKTCTTRPSLTGLCVLSVALRVLLSTQVLPEAPVGCCGQPKSKQWPAWQVLGQGTFSTEK